jgi:hypothetical protein
MTDWQFTNAIRDAIADDPELVGYGVDAIVDAVYDRLAPEFDPHGTSTAAEWELFWQLCAEYVGRGSYA